MKLELTDEEYFARQEISASDLKLIKKSVRHYLRKNENPLKTKSVEIGKMFHLMILEPNKFESEVVIGPDCDKRTKEYKDFLLTNSDKKVIGYDDFETLSKMKQSLLNHPLAFKIFGKGESETCYISELEIKSNSGKNLGKFGVRCKVDHIASGIVFDLKTTNDASLEAFQKSIVNYSYHIQARHYLNVLNSCGVKADKFAFICVENVFPYNVGVYALNDESLIFAQGEINDCFQRLVEYKESDNKFDGYSPQCEMVSLPNWYFNQGV